MQIGRWLESKGLEKKAPKPNSEDPAISDVSGHGSAGMSGLSGHHSTADGPSKPSAKSQGRSAHKTQSLLSRWDVLPAVMDTAHTMSLPGCRPPS